MKAFQFLLLFLVLAASTHAQSTWDGSLSADWSNPNNWTPAGVPSATDDVIIPAPIPSTLNPIIQSGTVASALSVTINGMAKLIIVNGGSLTINGSIQNGIYILPDGELENDGILNIGNTSATGQNGIRCQGVTNNLSNGQIKIDNSGGDGIQMGAPPATVNNSGVIQIGTLGGASNIGSYGIRNAGFLNNLSSSTLIVNNTVSAGIISYLDGVVVNDGEINVEFCRDGFDLRGDSNFTNNGGINIENITFNAIFNDASFINAQDGTIFINTSGNGLSNVGSFTNSGSLNIGTTSYIASNGIVNSGSGNFINNSTIVIGFDGSLGGDGLRNLDDASFINNPCASLIMFERLNNTSNVAMINDGYIFLNSQDTHELGSLPSLLVNNGAISDPPGTFPVDAAGFDNQGITVTRTLVNYCPFAISPAINIGPGFNYYVQGIYTDQATMNSAGSFDSNTNTFTPNNPIANGSFQLYYIQFEELSGGCPIVITWPVVVNFNDIITFTGAGDGSNWHDPLNWDHGVVPSYCYNVVIPPSFVVKIDPGQTGEGLTLCVDLNAELETLTGGMMDIRN